MTWTPIGAAIAADVAVVDVDEGVEVEEPLQAERTTTAASRMVVGVIWRGTWNQVWQIIAGTL
jgi:hypothetical protein